MMSLELEPGAVFEKKYRIVERIGKGGMAQIYRVESLDLNSINYALKLIRIPEGDPVLRADFLARFRREAELLWRLRGKRNAHIVDVHAYSETSELAVPYLLLEYLEGRDLERLLAEKKRLPVDTVLVLARQIGSALDAIHAAGIVHRDLSPQNIFVCEESGPEGEVMLHAKLLDFGVAKSLSKSDALLTHVNTFVGKPAYASPEQLMMVSELDARSDEFSLAAIIFEMLTGERAFMREGDSPQACCRRVLSSDPLLESKAAQEIPGELRAVLQRGLSKQPQNRYPTTRQFLRALEEATARRGSGEIITPAPPPVPQPGQTAVWIAVVAVAMLCAFMAYPLFSPHDSDMRKPAPGAMNLAVVDLALPKPQDLAVTPKDADQILPSSAPDMAHLPKSQQPPRSPLKSPLRITPGNLTADIQHALEGCLSDPSMQGFLKNTPHFRVALTLVNGRYLATGFAVRSQDASFYNDTYLRCLAQRIRIVALPPRIEIRR